ncbi:MAG: preprotein translocase subunit SecD [Halobacteriaceae archaeon]
MVDLRSNWRIILLVVLLVVSGIALFGPGIGASSGSTNLNYGLELAGGTRLRAPVVGLTAEGLNVTQGNEAGLERNVSDALGVDVIDVQARPQLDTIEIYSINSTAEFRAALQETGLSPTRIRQGVTAPTRQSIVAVLTQKINAIGLSGGSVSTARTPTGDYFIVVEAPNQNATEVRNLVDERGVVQLVASYPDSNGNGTVRTVAVRQNAIAGISPIETQQGRPVVPVTLTRAGAETFSAVMLETGFIDQAIQGSPEVPPGGTFCDYRGAPNESYCLLTILNGEVVYSSSLGEGLASDMRSGTFNASGEFVVVAPNQSAARELRTNLQTGALPASLDVENATTSFITGTRAGQYKSTVLVTGLAAVLAVSVVVFLRYGRPGVAAPMVVTAVSEVVILLGFAAAIRLPLDLSHLAGFIAVIGTGVDDLVIIADEVLTKEVSSSRVFKSRFRKALWVIGVAAATTIIAMLPLTQLSLGDLQGFAIITILGVLVGVLVTRPAYGDVLRNFLIEE